MDAVCIYIWSFRDFYGIYMDVLSISYGFYMDIYIYIIYVDLCMSHRKTPGNTKYVLDGHWFMEIDGNC